MTLVNTGYSIAPLWRRGTVSDSLIIPLGFDSSPGHKISNCGSPLTRLPQHIYKYMIIVQRNRNFEIAITQEIGGIINPAIMSLVHAKSGVVWLRSLMG